MTQAGWVALDLQGIGSQAVLTTLVRIDPGPISAQSTVDPSSEITAATAGVVVGMHFQARDNFGNALSTGGDADKVTFFEGNGDVSFQFKGLRDHDDGTYLLLFVGDRETSALNVLWEVDNITSPTGVTIAINRPALVETHLAGTGPGALYGAAAVSKGEDWYMFGGVMQDRIYSDKLFKFDKDPSAFFLHYSDITFPAADSEMVRLVVDTTNVRIKADCSDIRFTDAENKPLPFVLMPMPGCKSTKSVFLILRATQQ
eukprot:scaffold543248_cov39-Prasinocladus_malaysianus.AAC.1